MHINLVFFFFFKKNFLKVNKTCFLTKKEKKKTLCSYQNFERHFYACDEVCFEAKCSENAWSVGKKSKNTKCTSILAWGAFEVSVAYAFDVSLSEAWAFLFAEVVNKKKEKKTRLNPSKPTEKQIKNDFKKET